MRSSGPIFSRPNQCRHCQRRYDDALQQFTDEFRTWLQRRRAESVVEARALAALPVAERRRIRADRAAAAKADLVRRLAARKTRNVGVATSESSAGGAR